MSGSVQPHVNFSTLCCARGQPPRKSARPTLDGSCGGFDEEGVQRVSCSSESSAARRNGAEKHDKENSRNTGDKFHRRGWKRGDTTGCTPAPSFATRAAPEGTCPWWNTVVISTIYFRDNNYSHGGPSRTFIKQEFPPPCGRVYLTGVAELQRRYSVWPAIVRCDERWWSWWMPRIVRDYLHAGQLRLFCDCTSCWYFDGFYFLLEFIDAAFFFFFSICSFVVKERGLRRRLLQVRGKILRFGDLFNGWICWGLKFGVNLSVVHQLGNCEAIKCYISV